MFNSKLIPGRTKINNSEIYTYSLSTRICTGLFTPLGIVIFVIIVVLYGGIIHYEKWGNDPQKRSLANILMASFCWMPLIIVVASISFGSFRIRFGPLGQISGYSLIFIRQACIIKIMLCFLEILTLKVLQITYWSRMANLNDEFWNNTLKTFNGITVILLSVIMRTLMASNLELFFYRVAKTIFCRKKCLYLLQF